MVPGAHERRPQNQAQDDDRGAATQAADCAVAFRHRGRGAAGRHRACGVMEARGKRGEQSPPQLAGPQQGLPMTIRGGGNPKLHMVLLDRRRRMGPAAPELRHRCACCITVRSHSDLPHTSLPRDLRAWLGELASEICRRHLAPLETAHPIRQSLPPVLVTVKDKSLRDGDLRPTLDRHCARRPVRSQVGTRRWSPIDPNEKMRKRARSKLDNHRPTQV